VRINEITSAEEQIELWKLVSNSVWQSLQQQQEQQRRAQVASTSRAKRKPKTTVGMPIPKLPKVPTTRPPATVQQPTPTKQVGVQTQPSAIQPEGGQKTIGGSVYPSTGKMQMSPSQIKRRAGNTKEDERQNATNSDPLGVMGSNGRIKTSPISTVSR
jgi:hypothetical protein